MFLLVCCLFQIMKTYPTLAQCRWLHQSAPARCHPQCWSVGPAWEAAPANINKHHTPISTDLHYHRCSCCPSTQASFRSIAPMCSSKHPKIEPGQKSILNCSPAAIGPWQVMSNNDRLPSGKVEVGWLCCPGKRHLSQYQWNELTGNLSGNTWP